MEDMSPECSFCRWIPTTGKKIEGENFEHLYIECQFSKSIAQSYFNSLFSTPIVVRDVLAHGSQEEKPLCLIINIEVLLFSYYIYNCKLASKLPALQSFLHQSFVYKKMFLQASSKFRKSYTYSCRKYGDEILTYNKLLERNWPPPHPSPVPLLLTCHLSPSYLANFLKLS